MKYMALIENEQGVMIYGRIDDDGVMRVTCIEEDAEYQAWLKAQAALSTPNV